MANTILNFHFDYLNPSLRRRPKRLNYRSTSVSNNVIAVKIVYTTSRDNITLFETEMQKVCLSCQQILNTSISDQRGIPSNSQKRATTADVKVWDLL